MMREWILIGQDPWGLDPIRECLGRWAAAIALPGLLLLCGWGLGYFLDPLSSRPDALALWALLAASLPALFICAARPGDA